MDITDIKLDELSQEIEKIRRRKIVDFSNSDEIQYLDPLDNLKKIKAYNNHLIVGRRGSGKTTLLLSTIKEDKDNFIHPRDSQIFRAWPSNKTLINVLDRLLSELTEIIEQSDEYQIAKTEFKKNNTGLIKAFTSIFKKKSDEVSKYEEFIILLSSIRKLVNYLSEMDSLPDEVTVSHSIDNTKKRSQQIETKEETKFISKLSMSGKLKKYHANISANLDLAYSVSNQHKNSEIDEQKNTTKTKYERKIIKAEELDNIKLLIANLFSDFTRLTKKHIILYLDDFYLIPIDIQPIIAQFFHDIYKNAEYNSFCFKVCTLPSRTKLNFDGQVDFSYKDDFSPIKLDKELYDIENLKDFLLKITSNLKPSLNIAPRDINGLFNNDEVLNFTVVATGGVPRDFLITLAELVKIARTDVSDSIKKEHLYSAISDFKDDKEKNIEVDSDINPELLRKAIHVIEEEVVQGLKTNVILYPSTLAKKHEYLLKNLINLRYIHVINENTSSEKVKKESFVSYLVDMTFYATGKRLKQGFTFRPFWIKDNDSRHKYLRNAPIWNFDIEALENNN